MKLNFTFLFLIVSLSAHGIPDHQEASQIVQALEQDVCSKEAPANHKTEAEGVCLDCIYGTQSTPSFPKGLSPIQFSELKEKVNKKNAVMELEFWKLAEEKGLLAGGYSSVPTAESLNSQLKGYREQLKLIKDSKELFESIVKEPELFSQKIKGFLNGEKPDGLMRGVLTTHLLNFKPSKDYDQHIEMTKKYLAKEKIQAKAAEGLSSESYYLKNVKSYEANLNQIMETKNKYQNSVDWLDKGGKPVPDYINEKLLTLQSQIPEAKANLAQFNSSLKMYESAIAQVELKIANLDKEKSGIKQNGDDEVKNSDETLSKIEAYKKKVQAQVQDAFNVPGFKRCGMTDAEILALRWYTGSQYSWINKALRVGGDEAKKIAPLREILNRALRKLAVYKGEVGRGASLPKEVFEEHKVGAVVNYSAYTSTAIGAGFGSTHKFIIKSNKGRYVGSHSSNHGEREVLFEADTKFKILEVKGNEITMEEVGE